MLFAEIDTMVEAFQYKGKDGDYPDWFYNNKDSFKYKTINGKEELVYINAMGKEEIVKNGSYLLLDECKIECLPASIFCSTYVEVNAQKEE
jgi:hypothetical protein